MKASALIVILGLVLGNFTYQFFGDENWRLAFERSSFVVVAILLHCILSVAYRESK